MTAGMGWPGSGPSEQQPPPYDGAGERSKRKPLLIIGAIVGGILLMCGACGVGAVIGTDDTPSTGSPSTVTSVSTTTMTRTVTSAPPSESAAADDTTRRGLVPETSTRTPVPDPGDGDDDRNNRPRPVPPPPATDNNSGDDSSGGGASGPFSSCAEARAAGQTPLYRGDPGYSADLDRDGDGTACESG